MPKRRVERWSGEGVDAEIAEQFTTLALRPDQLADTGTTPLTDIRLEQ
jgi:hypothetical protein